MTVRTPSSREPGDLAGNPDDGSPRGATLPIVDGARAPRLPHERDESADSQALSTPMQDDVGKQASADKAAGKLPTDRSGESDRTYNANFDRGDEPPRP